MKKLSLLLLAAWFAAAPAMAYTWKDEGDEKETHYYGGLDGPGHSEEVQGETLTDGAASIVGAVTDATPAGTTDIDDAESKHIGGAKHAPSETPRVRGEAKHAAANMIYPNAAPAGNTGIGTTNNSTNTTT